MLPNLMSVFWPYMSKVKSQKVCWPLWLHYKIQISFPSQTTVDCDWVVVMLVVSLASWESLWFTRGSTQTTFPWCQWSSSTFWLGVWELATITRTGGASGKKTIESYIFLTLCNYRHFLVILQTPAHKFGQKLCKSVPNRCPPPPPHQRPCHSCRLAAVQLLQLARLRHNRDAVAAEAGGSGGFSAGNRRQGDKVIEARRTGAEDVKMALQKSFKERRSYCEWRINHHQTLLRFQGLISQHQLGRLSLTLALR